ncbi:MAG: hypothetical protein A3J97_15015 [Spirochaetes bacterium RIFOXYC1_FULL_54_7]|nr:MAG: hypothetical protein A3J97_15015 [Spirochaetes bacterium RIFOXYC1_FULL_54_7]
MPKKSLHELAQSVREGQSDQRKWYMAGVAEAVYESPGHYGFRSVDEVGEAFSHYWNRIESFPEHYSDTGANFEAYLTSSLRYIALSVRRDRAKEFDKQAVCYEEQYRDYASGYTSCSWSHYDYGESWCSREPGLCPGKRKLLPESADDSGSAKAFRIRLVYLCLKCAHLLDDAKLIELSKLVGVETVQLMRWIQKARHEMAQHSIRTCSRRRGRDSAWVRIGVNRRRLSREVDPERRQVLETRIYRDQGVYLRACQVIHNSRPLLSNKEVAEILGVSKGTVDSGVGRILRKYYPLYADEDG